MSQKYCADKLINHNWSRRTSHIYRPSTWAKRVWTNLRFSCTNKQDYNATLVGKTALLAHDSGFPIGGEWTIFQRLAATSQVITVVIFFLTPLAPNFGRSKQPITHAFKISSLLYEMFPFSLSSPYDTCVLDHPDMANVVESFLHKIHWAPAHISFTEKPPQALSFPSLADVSVF
jgi:hypothetical protein